jgi:purine-binding chemotaxis protein CheW
VSAPETAAEAGPRAFEALARAAARRELADERSLRREFVTFGLDGDPYALPIERVREIVRMRAITPVPRVPAAIRGVISLRGEVVEVLDLRRRFGLPERAPTRASRIIVLHGEDGMVTGLLVDSVRDVLRITEDLVRPTDRGECEGVSALLSRGDQFVSLLDLERVLDLAG